MLFRLWDPRTLSAFILDHSLLRFFSHWLLDFSMLYPSKEGEHERRRLPFGLVSVPQTGTNQTPLLLRHRP